MDIYCRHCGEPWDMECLHDEIAERDPAAAKLRGDAYAAVYSAMRAEWQRFGCGALYMHLGRPSPRFCGYAVSDQRMADASAVLGELLGDDVDGLAAMLEDVANGY